MSHLDLNKPEDRPEGTGEAPAAQETPAQDVSSAEEPVEELDFTTAVAETGQKWGARGALPLALPALQTPA